MPFKELMTWEKAKKRWAKMYNRDRHFFYPAQHGLPRTQDASREAANAWWLKKKAELDGFTQPHPIEEFIDQVLDDPPEEMRAAVELADELSDVIVPVQAYKRTVEAIQHGLNRKAHSPERTVKASIEQFLDLIRRGQKPKTFRELKEYLHTLYSGKGPVRPDDDVKVFDAHHVNRTYEALESSELARSTAKKRFGFYRRFVAHLAEDGLIPLPGNLRSRKHKFQVAAARKIKTFPVAEVRQCLESLPPRLRTYALLALNCSMQGSDIGQLKKEQIDLTAGKLTRRRVKTGDLKSTPTVTYKLWPETIALLREHWSAHDTLVLTSRDNTPLWVMTVEDGGHVRQKDLVLNQWRKKKRPMNLSDFRKVGATLLNSGVHKGMVQLYLGHAPSTVAEQHYAAPPEQLLAEATDWLRMQLFPLDKS